MYKRQVKAIVATDRHVARLQKNTIPHGKAGFKQNAPAFSVDFAAWKQNLLGCKWYMVGAAGSRCEHVFRELYESAFYEDPGFLQLKTDVYKRQA